MNNLPRLLPSAPTSTLTHCYLARQAAVTARLKDNTLFSPVGTRRARRCKGRLDLLLGARLLRFQVNRGARPLHDLALRFEFFLCQQVVQRGAKRFRAHAPPNT